MTASIRNGQMFTLHLGGEQAFDMPVDKHELSFPRAIAVEIRQASIDIGFVRAAVKPSDLCAWDAGLWGIEPSAG